MLIQIEDYEVIIYFVEAREMGRFARPGWRWATPWSPPEGPFATAADALKSVAQLLENDALPVRPPLKLE